MVRLCTVDTVMSVRFWLVTLNANNQGVTLVNNFLGYRQIGKAAGFDPVIFLGVRVPLPQFYQ